jgi:proline iminopeptidase
MKRRSVIGILAGVCVAASALTAHAQDDSPLNHASGVINIRGEPHAYLAEGRGEPCIVTGLAMSYPPLFSARLKRHIRFIYVDFSDSWTASEDRNIDSTTMDSLVQEVDDVRRAFALERACIVGHSSTGLIAIEYAARHPQHTSKAILIAVHPFWNQELFDAWRTYWQSDASPARKAALTENKRRMPDSMLGALSARDAFALRYVRNGPQLFFNPSYDFYWAWAGRQVSAPMFDRFWKVIVADYNPWERLSANGVPMFVALGRHDFAVPYHLWDGVRARTPGLKVELFDKSSHFPMFEEPGPFDAALLRWQRSIR